MLSLVKVDHVRDELLCIGIVLSWSLRIYFCDGLSLGLLSRGLAFGVFSLRCRSCSLLLLLPLPFFFLFLETLLLLLVNLFFFLFFFALLLDQLSVVLDTLQVRAEPILNTHLNLSALESPQDFLVAKDITVCEWVLDVGKQGVVLGHLDEVVGEHCLVKQVLGALDVVPIVLLDVARLTVRVYSD